MIIALIIFILLQIFFIFHISRAPEGSEDEKGFHLARPRTSEADEDKAIR